MRFIFLGILLFLTTLSYSQLRDSIYIKTTIFNVVYSEVLQQPKWIEYHVECSEGTFSRKGLDFFPVNGVVTSTEEDYEHNVWDKGHLAPAADFNCDKEHLKQTFSYLNCVLQHEKLNRGVWRELELYERELSKKHSVNVEIRMIYGKSPLKLSTGATVPDSFIKTIKYSNKKEIYIFKNEIPVYNDFTKYRRVK